MTDPTKQIEMILSIFPNIDPEVKADIIIESQVEGLYLENYGEIEGEDKNTNEPNY